MDRDRDRGNGRCNRKHKEQGGVRDIYTEEMCDEVQLSEKDNITQKRNKEREPKVFEAGEVFVEGFDWVIHKSLGSLEDLCFKEFFKKLL